MAIGKVTKRIEDPRLLMGKGYYVADIHVPGMLEAYVVRSPYAHARIQRIDSLAVMAAREVIAVFTAHDLPSDLPPIPMRLTPTRELEGALQMPLASDTVRYAGEPVAIIVARSRYAAEDASEDLQVDYEVLDAVSDVNAALRPGAPLIHPSLHSNNVHTIIGKKGNASEALQQAPHRLSLEFSIQRHAAIPMETRGLVAVPDNDGRLHVYGSTKVVHYNRSVLARLLNCDPSLPHFVETDIGGGFGARGEFYPEDFLIPYCLRYRSSSQSYFGRGTNSGGMAQGLGGALMEDLAYDDTGQLLSGTFMDYLLPGSCEVPDVEVILTEDAPSHCNPLGIKRISLCPGLPDR